MKTLLTLLILLGSPQDDLREQYDNKLEKLKDDDKRGHAKLADWCAKNKLWDLALEEYELVLELDPKNRSARKALGYKKKGKEWKQDQKIAKLWTYRSIVAEGLDLPDKEEMDEWRNRGRNYAMVLDVMTDLDVWVDAVMAIDEKLGHVNDTFQIRVVFKELGGAIAMGGGTGGGKGKIDVDMEQMAAQVDKIAKFKKGGFLHPPSPIPLIFKHELVHCYQGVVINGWILEGVPSYVAEDPHFISFYQGDNAKTDSVAKKTDDNYDYARGWAFFEYLEAKFGKEKVHKFIKLIYTDRKEYKSALKEATGKTFDEIAKDERSWSASWLRKYKVKK